MKKTIFERNLEAWEQRFPENSVEINKKWNEYHGYLITKVQPSVDGQFVRMNQMLQEDYEAIEAIIQILIF